MSLAPFAVADDVATRLGQTLTEAQANQVTAFLDDASALLRDYCRQDVNLVVGDTLDRQSPDGPWLDLPQMPVVGTPVVSVNGQTVGDFSIVGNRLYRVFGWRWPSVDTVPPLAIYGLMSTVHVVYSHGYDPIPDVFATVCRQMVMRALNNIQGFKSVALDDFQASFGSEVGNGVFLSEPDMRAVRRFRRVAYSIDIGGSAFAS